MTRNPAVSDRNLIDRLDDLTDDEVERFEFSMGPMRFDLGGFLGLRLNEHALHTWDIEVVGDPTATLSPTATRLLIDNLEMIVRFAGKSTGTQQTVEVHVPRDLTAPIWHTGIARRYPLRPHGR